MSENDVRIFLLMLRDLLGCHSGGAAGWSGMRRWLKWQNHEGFAELIKNLEDLPSDRLLEIQRALSTGQIESKLWMIRVLQSLLEAERTYRFHIVGGWVGILPLLLKWLLPNSVKNIEQIDIDPAANTLAKLLNHDWCIEQKVKVSEIDALDFAYDHDAQIVINAACEHFVQSDLTRWLNSIPAGRLVILQSNNLFQEKDHVNCHPDVYEFRKSMPLRTLLFRGEYQLENYTRFMLMGIAAGAPAN